MDRRRFLIGLSSLALAGCEAGSWLEVPTRVYQPGMATGHALRDLKQLPEPQAVWCTDTLILGSGAAGLSAGWQLRRQGYRNFLLLSGPEWYGNGASGQMGEVPYPRGAHYLPLPSLASSHVREMLAEMGVLRGDPQALRPEYDEQVLVQAPDERVFANGVWQEGQLPQRGRSADSLAQQQRFLAQVARLKRQVGRDGRPVFSVPLALSSQDPQWLALDRLSFAAWLDQQQLTDPVLRRWLDYSCRDDYGAPCDEVSAWAGLHYFAARGGHAANGEDGAVLTWPDGLNPVLRHLQRALEQDGQQRLHQGTALHIRLEQGKPVVLCRMDAKVVRIEAQQLICAMPLHVLQHVLPTLPEYGYQRQQALPHAAWLVSSFGLNRFPEEARGVELAWDNILHEGPGLGYVVATHQWLRTAKPQHTVFTAYQALSRQGPGDARRWLLQANREVLYDMAMCDLRQVYGRMDWWRAAREVEITVRGHGMSTPRPGFLTHPGLRALREHSGPILFAHSDLSGLSLFEEASWWGVQAANRVLGNAA
ncbi:NAD(P)-binding protein [Leeia sp.]|uniref:NAD(P)-binding protein n=1 Tax=Leeia sp. TaxID=2884678 RepID=UPI0035B0B4FC